MRGQLARLVYRFVGLLLVPLLMVYLWHRGRRAPAYRDHWLERFWGPTQSDFAHPRNSGPVLWVHAVSVGETQAVVPLLRAWLQANGPSARLVMTHTTPTGRQTGAQLCADWLRGPNPRMVQVYLPYDLPWANHRFLRWSGASQGLLMETELWPNLLAQAADHGVSVVLINARLSARSARQMQRLAWLARPALARLAMVCAQTPADAQRFVAVGYQGPVRVTGSLKFDLSIDAGLATLGRDWRSSWTFERVWLMASSREDEERPLFEAWARAKAAGELAPKTLLIVVPRHPERFESAVLMAQASGLVVSRRSEQVALAPETEVWVGDSLGEMAAYVAASDLALMGGSIAPLGGQNPIEICAQGRPVFFGRHMFNFHQIARMLQEVRAGFLVADHQDFIRQATRLSQDPSGQQKAAQEAQAFVLAHRGATERTLAALLEAPGY
ncbi:MAG: hypothetical protein RL483_919 [Pseudomonadota bacterium]